MGLLLVGTTRTTKKIIPLIKRITTHLRWVMGTNNPMQAQALRLGGRQRAGVAADVANGASGAYLSNIANRADYSRDVQLRILAQQRRMYKKSHIRAQKCQLGSAAQKTSAIADDLDALSGSAKFGSKLIPGLGVGLTAVSEFSDPADRSTKERVANTAIISGAGMGANVGVAAGAGLVCAATLVCGGAVVTGAAVVGLGALASWGAGAVVHHYSGWLS